MTVPDFPDFLENNIAYFGIAENYRVGEFYTYDRGSTGFRGQMNPIPGDLATTTYICLPDGGETKPEWKADPNHESNVMRAGHASAIQGTAGAGLRFVVDGLKFVYCGTAVSAPTGARQIPITKNSSCWSRYGAVS